VQRWVDVANDDFGVTWVTPDAPLMEVGGITANLIGSLAGSPLWRETLDPSTTIYSWAMNNHWHTNYRAEQEGPTRFRYVIWPHDDPFDASQATRRALECTQPLLVLPARGEKPMPPVLRVRGNRGAHAVEVSALKPSDDGQAWIVRLFAASDEVCSA
jgi:alpha-mannosidase